MTEKDLLLSLVTKIFAKTDEEVAALLYNADELKDDAFDQLVALDTAKVSRLKKQAGQEYFDNGHKKGKKEALESFEKEFKEHTSFASDKMGMDLILDWGENLKTATDVTDDKIKTHPVFLSAEKSWRDKHEAEVGKIKTEYETFKNEVIREKQFTGIRTKAREVFVGLNPVLSDDPQKAERQINTFLGGLQNFDFSMSDGLTLITQGGQRIEDEHGNPIPFDTFVARQAEQLFDFRKQGEKGNAGNDYTPGARVIAPKTEEEYNRMISAEPDSKKRIEIQDAYYKTLGKTVAVK